jgi:hypothetical protein
MPTIFVNPGTQMHTDRDWDPFAEVVLFGQLEQSCVPVSGPMKSL